MSTGPSLSLFSLESFTIRDWRLGGRTRKGVVVDNGKQCRQGKYYMLLSWNRGHPGKFSFFIFSKSCVVNADISVSRQLHRDINGNNGRVDVIALAVGRHNKSGRQKAQQERLEQGGGCSDTVDGRWTM